MPVGTSVPLRTFGQEDFGQVAYEVVGCAFEVHAELGRVFFEPIYRSAMGRALGDRSAQEMCIVLTHRDFYKELFVDLIVDSGCPFELKVASSLTSAHECQLIQYLMLTGLSHGKLINFGTERVEHKFVNCLESPDARRRFKVERVEWPSSNLACHLEETVLSLLNDWGTGLTKALYREALLHLLDAEQHGQFIQTFWKGAPIGRQPVDLLADGVALEISCVRKDFQAYHSHLERFLTNTDLSSIFWVNICSGCVRFLQLFKESQRGQL